MDWSVLTLWEWQAMTTVTLLSAGLAWWTKRRLFRATALGGIAVILLSVSLWDLVSPGWTLLGISGGALLLLLMAKQILEPARDSSGR
ncbi:hypothetical protein [Paludifilum halophilum]|uniref:Uncharacterized protein n=1 Tax=Paludifilum halophilum TaxID=1642702 RepID=A0A235B5K2_9BACL|nr:hypothetical protein [Paludifilum halophilum]OYD07512.1 hypothetical protein CHM34_11500 [Paludifilum halophilum]